MSLSNVQKFGYLKEQLEGTAAMIVEGFALTNTNKRAMMALYRSPEYHLLSKTTGPRVGPILMLSFGEEDI